MKTLGGVKPSSKLTLLVNLLDRAVRVVPAARYFGGVVAASVTVGIIALINSLSWLTVVAILAAIIAMVIFYIFSRIEKSIDVVVKLSGYTLIIVATLAFIFVIVTSAWLALACKPRLLAYLYGVSQVCYAPPPMAARSDTASPSPAFRDMLVDSWGVADNGAFYVRVNSDLLLKYQYHFKLMLILEVEYVNLDRITDIGIDKSDPFTITDGIINIAIPVQFSSTHLRLGNPPNSKPGDQYKRTVDFNIVIIPDDLSTEQIRSLSDVQKLGGQIIRTPSTIVTLTVA